MLIEEEMTRREEAVNQILYRYLPKEEGYQKTIFEAMNYSIKAGGKRLRPIIMQETYRLFGGTSAVVEPFMAAMEMIHTYSLVHDDLPAMDNDEYRRGKKTTHVVYGEAMGILAGDALLNYAYETAIQAFEIEPQNPRIGKALWILARKAGIYGMVGGQVVDVEAEKQNSSVQADGQPVITREKLDFIYRLKTGALMESSMMVGAVLAGADDRQIAAVEQIAADVGMAFQIQDDILDITSTMEELGKPIGSDDKNQKATFVTFAGIEESQKEVERLSGEAVAKLDALGGEDVFLRELFIYLIHRRK